jgi:AraC-like DNA-binding protein
MPATGNPSIVAGLFARVLEVGVTCGLDRKQLLGELGVDPAVLEDRDNRLPVETFARLWQVVATRCPDRILALEWLRAWKITDAGLMGYLLSHLRTVREAAETMGRYGHLVNQGASARLVEGSPTSRICYSLVPVLLGTQHAAEVILASLTSFLRGVGGQEFRPAAVRVPHPATPRTPALERFFGVEIRHEAGEVSLEVENQILDRPLPGADPVLAAYLRKQVEAVVQQVDAPNAASQECARRIAERLGGGEPSQAAIAKQMAMSERTLQRRLQAEGTTFNELLEQARRTIACSYLADRKLAAYEVSFLLGYSEPATFFRAFKRWTGKTPQQYRATAPEA